MCCEVFWMALNAPPYSIAVLINRDGKIMNKLLPWTLNIILSVFCSIVLLFGYKPDPGII